MLCDTLGVLNPEQVEQFVGAIVEKHPDRHFDFHGHNDYGLAVANTLASARVGARGVHMTVNGMGERAGNTPLDEVVVALRDHLNIKTKVREKSLKDIGRLVEVFSGRRVSANKPITGDNVFTQTAGVHADGDMKGDLYESRLSPARFGQDRHYAMGKLMGKASLEFNLRKLNIVLDREQRELVLDKIVELSDQKKTVTAADLPFIIADVLQTPEHRIFEVKDFSVTSTRSLPPTATVQVQCHGKDFVAVETGDGGYDAFTRALRKLEPKMKIRIPKLIDYEVHIPPGGKTDALVETTIKWEGGFKTRAVHSDQLVAAIEATAHAVNLFALQNGNGTTAKKHRSGHMP
jgi:D-citramalate synthase